jgi:hypothetical protein
MKERLIEARNLQTGEDWVGNNIAVTCPAEGCAKVFLVSATLHRTGRECPACGNSKAL